MTDNLNKKSILIVDDDVMSICALKDIICSEFIVHAVKSGEEAIEKAKKITPDVILLDVCMPQMDGYETIKLLKSSECTKDIPVIFISGCTTGREMEKGIAKGATDYISKPFTGDLIISKINKIFENTQMHA